MGFICRGAKKISSKKFPVIDYFRELSVSFVDNDRDLFNLRSCDLIRSFDDIALNRKNFEEANKAAVFILKNTVFKLSLPKTYNIFIEMLKKMAENTCSTLPWVCIVKIIYLSENGLLESGIDFENENDRRFQIMKKILNMPDGANPPNIKRKYWEMISEWTNSMCRFSDLSL